MARKETKQEKGRRLLNAGWSDEELNDSLVVQRRKELQEEEARIKREEEAARLKPDFSNVRGSLSLDQVQTADTGYDVLGDIGVSARQGAASVTKGALGLPVNLANLVAAPFMDSPFQQPKFVQGMRETIDQQQEGYYNRQASDKLKAKNQEFQDADGLVESAKFLATNPGYLGLQGFQQGPQLIASGPGGVAQKVITGALNAAGQAEEGVGKILREAGYSEEEIADRSSKAFTASLALNAATPYALKSTFLEGLLGRAAKGRVTDGVLKAALANTSKEVQEGVVTEVGDQYIQNLASNKEWDDGLAQAAVLGAAFSAAVAGPAATIESAAEAGRSASKLQDYLRKQKFNKEAADLIKPSTSLSPDFVSLTQQGDLFGQTAARIEDPAPEAGTAVGTDTEGRQQALRTQAVALRAQLEQDTARAQELRTRMEMVPFAEEAANPLTRQEETDLVRLEDRIATQQQALGQVEANIAPIQDGLGFTERTQPKNPKFTGGERTVADVRSDYYKTQPKQGPAPLSAEQRKVQQADMIAEIKRSKAEVKKADDKAKSDRARARKLYLEERRKAYMDLTPEARAKELAVEGRQWDAQNPLVIPSKQVAPVKPAAAVPPAAPVVSEDTPSVPVSTLTDTLSNAPDSSVALPSAAPTGRTSATLDDVQKAVGGGKRGKLASRLSYMIEDGNLEIVQDESSLPPNIKKVSEGGETGWFDPDTGKQYIVAGNLDKNNIKGDILANLAHETKHAGDFGGSEGLAKSFEGFVGAKANDAMIAKIRAAAKGGKDQSAVNAMKVIAESYQSRGLNADEIGSEVVAAYISQEAAKKGAKTALYRSIVSPLISGGKRLLRNNDVALRDIHYMADKLVGEVARRGEKMQANPSGVALPMFVGPQAKTAKLGNKIDAEKRITAGEDAELIRQDTGWHQGADGNMRFEISDHEATSTPAFKELKYGGKPLRLKEALDHPTLYEAYPWLKLVRITREPGSSPSIQGWAGNLEINVTPSAEKPESTLLHEVQHIIQEYENWAPGGSQETVFESMSEEQRARELPKVMEQVTKKAEAAINSANLFDILKGVPKDTIKRISDLRRQDKEAFDQVQKVQKFGYAIGSPEYRAVYDRWKTVGDRLDDLKSEVLINFGLDPKELDNKSTLNQIVNGEDAAKARDTWNSIALREQKKLATLQSGNVPAINAALKESSVLHNFYKRLAGEVEARTTQYRQKLTPEQRVAEAPVATLAEQYDEVKPGDEIVIPRNSDSNEESVSPMPSVAKKTDNDRRDIWGRAKDSNRAIRAISNLLSTTGGYGQQVFELLNNRSNDRAVLAYRAEELEANMREGIKQAAKLQGVSTKSIDDQLNKALDEINNLPTKEARDAAIKNLDTKYPGVGTALVEIRDLKWSLARAVVTQRRAEGRDLTEKENNVINKMMERQETWTTRAYESGQMNAKKLAKARMSRYKKNPESKEAQQFKEDVEFLRDNYIIIPPKDALLTMKASELRNYYETWLGDSAGKSEGDMVEALSNIPKYSDAALQKKLDGVVRELVGLDTAKSKTARGFTGTRQNRTVLEGRENIPPAIRRMMGEITNSVAKEVLSVARLSSLYTQNKVLASLAENYKGVLWEDHAIGDFSIPVTGENYGPLRGKFVTPSGSRVLQPVVNLGMNAEEALNTINEDGANALGKGLAATANAVQKTAGVTKVVSLIWNLGAAGANWCGAWGALTANGVGVNRAWDAHKLTFKAIRARYQPNLYTGQDKIDIRNVLLSGVLDSATTGEYQQRLFSTVFNNLAEDATPKDLMRSLNNAVNDGILSSKDFYAFMDMWAKVAAWVDRREFLTNMYKADGITKAEDDIIREAGHDITAANISWVRAPAVVKAVEKYLGPLAMFFVYFMEVPRSTAYSYALAAKDWNRAKSLETKEAKDLARDSALRRLVGTTMYIAGVAGTMAYLLNGMGEDEERRRKTDPKWEQKGLNVPLGKTKDGQDIQYNALRVDFIGPLNELLTKLATQDDDDTTAEIIKSYATDQFVKNKAMFSLMRSIKSLAGMETVNFDDSDNELVNRLDQLSWGKDHNLGKNLADTVDKFTPATPRGIYKTIKGVTGSKDYEFSVSDNPVAAVIQATGLKLSVRDPERSLEFATSAYNKAKKEASSGLAATKKRFGRLDAEDLIGELDDVITDERKAYKELHEVYDGVVAFNGYYSDKDYAAAAKKILKDKKLGDASSDIKSGVFNVRFISKDYINEWELARRTAIKDLPDNKKSEASAKLRTDIKTVKDYLNSRSK